MTKTKAGRVTSGFREVQTTPPGSFPPHMQHLKPKRRQRPTERQRARKAAAVGEARVNGTVALVRSLETPARKRGAARYGQAPKNPPKPSMQSPAPMGAVMRSQAYTGDGRWRLSARQERQIDRMVLRNADRHAATDLVRDLMSRKGRATPKRKASR